MVLNGCATESSRSLDTQTVRAASTATLYQGAKLPISVGKFNNRSNYHNGVFSDDMDQLGNQSKTILVSYLQQTGRFLVLDRGIYLKLLQRLRFKVKTAFERC